MVTSVQGKRQFAEGKHTMPLLSIAQVVRGPQCKLDGNERQQSGTNLSNCDANTV